MKAPRPEQLSYTPGDFNREMEICKAAEIDSYTKISEDFANRLRNMDQAGWILRFINNMHLFLPDAPTEGIGSKEFIPGGIRETVKNVCEGLNLQRLSYQKIMKQEDTLRQAEMFKQLYIEMRKRGYSHEELYA